MQKLRKYGQSPYEILVIHGGPGAPGEVAPLAIELSKYAGILEPFQTKDTIDGQVEELNSIIKAYCKTTVQLIGHSWGAWLSFMYTSKYPSNVSKLFLIGSPSFEDRYNRDIMKIRMNRLTENERSRLDKLSVLLTKPNHPDSMKIVNELMGLLLKADSYDHVTEKNEIIEFQPRIFQKVWLEAQIIRSSGELLKAGSFITCSVVAIHGENDPHPVKGVEKPLSSAIKDFRIMKLSKCGHYPWLEKYAKDEFYRILDKELKAID